ncbi:MAG: deoxyribodipyrimidine photolyase, partial [Bacteroidota bacterium]
YYHLLDADWASNALSWQWVAGAFSSKKYFANQENINKYANTNQQNTFLDCCYEALAELDLSSEFGQAANLNLETVLPENSSIQIQENFPTYIYNFYNLDPNWNVEADSNNVLLLEPSFFKKYPVGKNSIDFIISLSKNIKNMQLFVGEFSDLKSLVGNSTLHFKEHPTTNHYIGVRHERDWIFEQTKGYFPSFFSYWNKASKHAFWNKK